MDINKLKIPLDAKEIDFRIQSINKGGYATIIPYKDARVDIKRLNAVCGPLGWKREHSRDNQNCTVSIYDFKYNHWVSKEDTGTVSMTEAQKGLASDSFKRACFNWEIGLELYDYPVIQIQLKSNEVNKDGGKPRATWALELKKWSWYSEFTDGKISFLAAKDNHGNKRFAWGKMTGSKENKGPLIIQQTAYQEHHLSIAAVKQALNEDPPTLDLAIEAWFEIPVEDRYNLLKVAPSKGGLFTTSERELMDGNEFRNAYQEANKS